MDSSKRRAIPARLARVRKRFDAWRRTRRAGTRIPEPLWASAVKLAGTYGISQTAVALRLNYELLRKRVEKKNSASPSSSESAGIPAFVELANSSLTGLGEWILDFEDAEGASMRVHLKGVDAPDLIALAHSFWGVGR